MQPGLGFVKPWFGLQGCGIFKIGYSCPLSFQDKNEKPSFYGLLDAQLAPFQRAGLTTLLVDTTSNTLSQLKLQVFSPSMMMEVVSASIPGLAQWMIFGSSILLMVTLSYILLFHPQITIGDPKPHQHNHKSRYPNPKAHS